MPASIVIDEFASLVRELPDFVTGLVNIAQRGRSLGIHLILATQRPSGVVSPEIRANTNLRIALRVTDAAGVHRRHRRPGRGPDRQEHPRPGLRAARPLLARPVPGRPGRRPPAGRRAGPPPASPASSGWDRLDAPIERPQADRGRRREETDLQVLVDAIRQATERAGVPRSTARGCRRSPSRSGWTTCPTPAEQPGPATRPAGCRRSRTASRTCPRSRPRCRW